MHIANSNKLLQQYLFFPRPFLNPSKVDRSQSRPVSFVSLFAVADYSPRERSGASVLCVLWKYSNQRRQVTWLALKKRLKWLLVRGIDQCGAPQAWLFILPFIVFTCPTGEIAETFIESRWKVMSFLCFFEKAFGEKKKSEQFHPGLPLEHVSGYRHVPRGQGDRDFTLYYSKFVEYVLMVWIATIPLALVDCCLFFSFFLFFLGWVKKR